jgi:hypothetical protein
MLTLAFYQGVSKEQRLGIFLTHLHTQQTRHEVVGEDNRNSELKRRLK